MRWTFVSFVVAFAGSIASAQDSQLINEVSTDGGNTWSASADVLPGSTFHVRVRCRLLPGPTTLGFAGLTFQPVLNGWRSDLGDTRNTFTFPGLGNFVSPGGLALGELGTETSFIGRHVANTPESTGRIFPFGAAGQFEYSSSGLLTSFNDPGNILRFAGSKNTTPTLNPAWGVAIGQLTANDSGSFFVTSRAPTVFKYAVTLSNDPSARTLVADIPASNIYGQAAWYQSTAGTQVLRTSLLASGAATINVIPSPTATLVLSAAGLASTSRRRRLAQ